MANDLANALAELQELEALEITKYRLAANEDLISFNRLVSSKLSG